MDVSFLQPVLEATGPFATVCADVTHTTENADTELDLRVRAISERLAEQGAPEPAVPAGRGRVLGGNGRGGGGPRRGPGGGRFAGRPGRSAPAPGSAAP